MLNSKSLIQLSKLKKISMPIKPYSGDINRAVSAVLPGGGAPLTSTSALKLKALARKMGFHMNPDFILERTKDIASSGVTGNPLSGFAGGIAALGPIDAAHEIGHAKIRHGLASLFNTTPTNVDKAIHAAKSKAIVGKAAKAADEFAASAIGAAGLKKVYGTKTMLSALPTYARGFLSHLGIGSGNNVTQMLQPYNKVPAVKKYLITLADAAKKGVKHVK